MRNRVDALGKIRIEAPWTTRLRRAAWHFCKKKPLGALGLVICVGAVLVGLFAPVVATHDPLAQDAWDRLQSPSTSHWLGTDDFGRDLYSRIVEGTRVSIIVAFFAIGIGTSIGLVLGIISGYFGGWVDNLLQRITEILLAFPTILFALSLVAIMGASLSNVVIALTIVFAPRTLRVIRGTVLSVKENVYVDAARSIGATPMRIMARHIAPNIMAPYLILASALLGSAILIEATLSFLGLGVPPPHPSWGRMLSGGAQMFAMTAPWVVLFPGIAITLLVLGFNVFGDALRDVWDPKLRGR
ncbi:ABC transporter permease [Chloroflexota bacterium]